MASMDQENNIAANPVTCRKTDGFTVWPWLHLCEYVWIFFLHSLFTFDFSSTSSLSSCWFVLSFITQSDNKLSNLSIIFLFIALLSFADFFTQPASPTNGFHYNLTLNMYVVDINQRSHHSCMHFWLWCSQMITNQPYGNNYVTHF